MHFPDLSPCTYHPGPLDAAAWSAPLLAVGWLDHPHVFPTGPTPSALSSVLANRLEETSRCFSHRSFRGLYCCTLCLASGREFYDMRSSDNLLVPGGLEIFAAPGAVVHYIDAHGYEPPGAFVQAVMACPPCDSPAYLEALRRINGTRHIPLQTAEEDRSEWRNRSSRGRSTVA
jgi:hypothetical protein